MFTGIVQAVGTIRRIEARGGDFRLFVDASAVAAELAVGDSLCVSGVCLTVVACENKIHAFDVSTETLALTTLGALREGDAVNLEPALRLSDRLGGHLVSGHVDGVGQVVRFEPVGDCMLLSIRAPHALSRYIAVKGSVAIDGVSLTVNSVEGDVFSINLIPHTLEATTLQQLGVGSRTNLEIDLIARYVDRMTQWQTEGEGDSA